MISCVWKEWSSNVDENKKYVLVEKNTQNTFKDTPDANNYSVAIGTTPLLPSKVTFWHIKLVKAGPREGSSINIDVAPFDINQNYWNECVKRE